MYTGKSFVSKNHYGIFLELYELSGRYLGDFLQDKQFTCFDQRGANTCSSDFVEKLMSRGFVDCGTNEDLFLAIAALRDDSDIHQWFILDKNTIIENSKIYQNGLYKKGSIIKCCWESIEDNCCGFKAHKASINELIEYFNKVEI